VDLFERLEYLVISVPEVLGISRGATIESHHSIGRIGLHEAGCSLEGGDVIG
jgi:hypothetical protein